MTTETSGSGDVARTLELLWGTGERPTRGPKPGLSLDRIVMAAVELADTEGLGALSMRRLATELGTGAMSLYRYVPGKAELLDLMLDRVSDPGPYDPPKPGERVDWQIAVETMARGFLTLYQAHPWLLKVNQARSVLGPSTVRSLEAALIGLEGMGLRDPELISVIISTQSFVQGIARMEAEAQEAVEATGTSHVDFWKNQEPFLVRAMASGKYPRMASLAEDTFSEDFDHFEFGLQRLLDGLKMLVQERSEAKKRPAAGAAGPDQ
ncbi:TetR/AcrR family transcriptional regulator [Streptomyces albipurpureus]|uniref:TetR/AcrR family transcriptional regulator n=1 Tax=Streptomyces albipurpureus TaxID=2897419 RepID=A0ABT0UTT6_9ACTN|nr:TetR/AcrR family transcriptional regulator [Streptomyces sp. CWNU-1]MCM2391859.1 TetR/AcrR family transcriptional regulator [Streptomyces sp. CWNU-1]